MLRQQIKALMSMTGMFFPDGNGNCYQYNQGPRTPMTVPNSRARSLGRMVWRMTGGYVPGKVHLGPVPCEDMPAAPRLPTTPEQNEKIYQCAKESQELHDNPRFLAGRYNVYSNNCTDAMVGVLSCAGVKVPNGFNPIPNDWYNNINQNQNFTPIP